MSVSELETELLKEIRAISYPIVKTQIINNIPRGFLSDIDIWFFFRVETYVKNYHFRDFV